LDELPELLLEVLAGIIEHGIDLNYRSVLRRASDCKKEDFGVQRLGQSETSLRSLFLSDRANVSNDAGI
jgi:hypothetical protein